MGNIVSPDGSTMMSGNSTSGNSGYTGVIYDGGNYTSYVGTYNYPEEKYYDKYNFGTSSSQRIRNKLRDGIKETYFGNSVGWYEDGNLAVSNINPWFNRGGVLENGGIFRNGNTSAYGTSTYSTCFVIIPKN